MTMAIRTAIRSITRLKIVCRKMYSRSIPNAWHDLGDLRKPFGSVALILVPRFSLPRAETQVLLETARQRQDKAQPQGPANGGGKQP